MCPDSGPGPILTTGAILLALAGLGSVGVGIFNEDAYLVEHSIFALDTFVTSALSVLVLAPVLARASRWGPAYAIFSRLCGIVALVSLVLFAAGVGGSAYAGLVERLIAAPVLLWFVITGLRLWHLPHL